MPGFRQIVAFVDLVARYVSMALVALIAGVILLSVFFRYVIGSSLQWSEEIAVMGLTWTVFLGSVVLIKNWQHIAVPTFVNRLPRKWRAWVMLTGKLLSIAFLLVVIWYGIEVFNAKFHMRSSSLQMSTKWAKLAIPVSAVLMLFFAVNVTVKDILALLASDYDHFEPKPHEDGE